MGTCLELDPAVVLQAEVNGKPEFDVPKHLRFVVNLQGPIIYKFSLGVSIGYNFTDSTYGWNGFMDGFTGMEESILICIIYECFKSIISISLIPWKNNRILFHLLSH